MQAPNVSPDELAKFAKLSHEWWDLDGPLKTLHDINPLRLEFIVRYATLKHRNLLDIGCGGGILSEVLAKAGARVTAIDGEVSVITAAQLHAKQCPFSIDYQCISDHEYAQQHPASFDAITCMELLEHVPEPSQIIKSCATLLKPGGKLFLSTINRTFKAYTLVILGAEYLLRLLPQNTHTYNKFIRPSELASWLRRHGFTLIEMTGVKYNPLTRSASFTPNVDVNYMVVCEKQ